MTTNSPPYEPGGTKAGKQHRGPCTMRAGGRSWGKQQRGLRTKALMQGLGIGLETLWKFTFAKKSTAALTGSKLPPGG